MDRIRRHARERLLDSVRGGDRLVLVKLNEFSGRVIRSSLEICSIKRGSEVGYLAGNPRLQEERCKEEFLDPVDEALAGMVDLPGSPQSPLAEALHRISAHRSASAEKVVIVYSDWLQHSDIASVLGAGTPTDSEELVELLGELQGIEVDPVMLVRSDLAHLQDTVEQDLWTPAFSETRASVAPFERL